MEISNAKLTINYQDFDIKLALINNTGHGKGSGIPGPIAESSNTDRLKAIKAAASFIHRWSWKGVKSLPSIAAEQILKGTRPKGPIRLYRFEREDHSAQLAQMGHTVPLQSWSKDLRTVKGIVDLKNEEQPRGQKYIIKSKTFQPHEIYADFTNLPHDVSAEVNKLGGHSNMEEVVVYHYK